MRIVGVGCGPGMLTEEAARCIAQARRIYGSGRAISLARGVIPPECEVHEIRNFSALDSLPADAIVLSTGDPMLAGLGHLGGEVIPGISSLQLAAARLRIPLERVSVVVAHARDHGQAISEACVEVQRGKLVFLLPDPEFPVEALASGIASVAPLATIALCEDLGYPTERIERGPLSRPPVPRSTLYSLLVGII